MRSNELLFPNPEVLERIADVLARYKRTNRSADVPRPGAPGMMDSEYYLRFWAIAARRRRNLAL